MKKMFFAITLIFLGVGLSGCTKGKTAEKPLSYVDFSDTDYQLFRLGEIQYHMPVGYKERDLNSDSNDKDQSVWTLTYENEERTCTYFVGYITSPKAKEAYEHVIEKEYQEEYIKSYKEGDGAFELRSSKNIVIDGNDAWEIEYIKTNYEGKTVYSKELIFATETGSYSIRLSDKTGTTGTYSDDFEGVINSISFR